MSNILKFKNLLAFSSFCLTCGIFFENISWAKQDELSATYVNTLNNKGWMFNNVFDSTSKEYVEFASKDHATTLELGAGKGATAAELVNKRISLKNNSEVFINELSEEHLKIAVNEYPVLKNKKV